MRLLVGLLLLGGCDYIFHLEHHDVGEPGSTDASPPDSAPLICPAPDAQISVPIIADATLGTIPHGGDAVLDGTGGNIFLLEFDIGDLSISSYTLTLTRAPHAYECDTTGGCAVCPQSVGNYNVYYSTTDWVEASATSSTRDGVQSWTGTNASGFKDISTFKLTSSFQLDAFVVTQTFNPADLQADWDHTKLAFHIQGAGASARFFSREGLQCDEADHYAPPSLVVRCFP